MRVISAVDEFCNACGVSSVVSFDYFKKIHINDRTAKGGYTRNSLIASITEISTIVQDGSELLEVKFGVEGRLGTVLLDANGSRLRKAKGPWRGYNCKHYSKGKKDAHIVVCIQNVDMSLEALLLICDDIHRDKMLASYTGMHANVKDGTGTIPNAYLAKPNMDIDNLEWCLSSDNLLHGRAIRYVQQCCFGEAYSYSALDKYFLTMLQLKDIYPPAQVYAYVKQHFKRTL